MNTDHLSFFVIGVQKAGTTALDHFLRQHREVQMGRTKELHFFDDETRNWDVPDYQDLHAAFDDLGQAPLLRGESTPSYIYEPQAIPRLQRYNPHAKLIAVLRHPTFRAFSHWRMQRQRGIEPLGFLEAIGIRGRDRVRTAPHGVLRPFSYVERGFYAQQFERVYTAFPRAQVHVFTQDAFWRNFDVTLESLRGFLGIGPFEGLAQSYVVTQDARRIEGEFQEARPLLDATFANDIVETARLTGLDLRHWLSADYQEAGPPPGLKLA